MKGGNKYVTSREKGPRWIQLFYIDSSRLDTNLVEGAAANKETRECGDSTSAGVEVVSASFVGHLGNLLLVI